jgi:hypothetical protein
MYDCDWKDTDICSDRSDSTRVEKRCRLAADASGDSMAEFDADVVLLV